VYGLETRRHDSRFVFFGLLIGLLSLLGGTAYLEIGWFGLAAALLTCYLIVLDFEYLFSDFKD
jgi:hypothetical protein